MRPTRRHSRCREARRADAPRPMTSRPRLRDRLRRQQLGGGAARARRASGSSRCAQEQSFTGMPTAVFYGIEGRAPSGPHRQYGRAAIAAYVEGHRRPPDALDEEHPRLDLVERSTEVGGGHSVRYLDVIGSYLRHSAQAEARAGAPLERVGDRPPGVLRRRRARARRRSASRDGAGGARGRIRDVRFRTKPIAAALRLRTAISASRRCWWPTSAAALRTSAWCAWPAAAHARPPRTTSSPTTACTWRAPISTAASNCAASCRWRATARSGRRADGAAPREVPSAHHFDLATWHLINSCLHAGTGAGATRHARLVCRRALHARRHPRPAARPRAGGARRGRQDHEVAAAGAPIDLDAVEAGLATLLRESQAMASIAADANASSALRARRCRPV